MTRARSIFISYRRRHSADITGRIYDRLIAHFGPGQVFKDVDAIPLGVNYRHHLRQAVSQCPVLLAVIDPQWLGVTDSQGRPKLANPSDWVRVEIETALERDRLVIPVLVNEGRLPAEADLPEGLKALAYRQSAKVRPDPDFHRDMDRLISRIEEVFSGLATAAAAAPTDTASLIDDLAAALATANQAAAARLGRRRWLRLMGLGLVGGGTAVAARQRVLALPRLRVESWRSPGVEIEPVGDRLSTGLNRPLSAPPEPVPEPLPEPLPESAIAPANPFPYTYESVSLDERGIPLTVVTFSTQTYAEIVLKGADGPVRLPMVVIPGGQFLFGAPSDEPGYDPTQPGQAIVTVAPFWMGIYPVTQAQWQAVAALPPINRALKAEIAAFGGRDRPVEQVSWPEAVEFCDRLSRSAADQLGRLAAGVESNRFRLPTEAEWEYACRAKTTTPFHTGPTLTTALANYNGTQPYRQEPAGEFRQTTTVVGSLGTANDFGLYDMHGNVLEWCFPGQTTQVRGEWRAVRGGSWQSPARLCRSAYRAGFKADTRNNQIGFRIVAPGPVALS